MLLVTSVDPINVRATTEGMPIYLDNHSFIELAEGNSMRRDRFIEAVRRGLDLVFSLSNAAELSRSQGDSARKVQDFLDLIGARWFPVELDPFTVTQRELHEQKTGADTFVSRDFLRNILAMRGVERLNDPPDELFGLGAVFEGWLSPQRDSIADGLRQLDTALIERINSYRQQVQADASWLDRSFPILQFNPSKPASFAYVNLVRLLIVDRAFQLKRGDGIDFCHAVIGSSFASAMTLDTQWKRRIDALPKPNSLARVYSPNQIDEMLRDLENHLESQRR